MEEINFEIADCYSNTHKEIISFKCELNENLQIAMEDFIDKHPNWDQYRIIQAAIAGFLMQNGFHNRNLTRLYLSNLPHIGRLFSNNFED